MKHLNRPNGITNRGMKQVKWGRYCLTACLLIGALMMTNPVSAYADTTSGNNTTNHDTNNNTNNNSNNDSYYAGAYSSTEYIKPGNYWFTPSGKYGEFVTVTLPIVNMTPYSIKDVIITPVISGDPRDWPFEITQTNYVLKLDSLAGSNVEPDVNKRTKNLFWTFKVRDDVLNGYYPISYQILYTDEACNQGSCTISTFIKCTGKPGAGSMSGEEDSKTKSTPRIIVTGFETSPAEVFAGDNFMLTLHVQNTSTKTAVQNVEFDLEAAVEGKDESATYAAFLPTSGSNTVYVDSIPMGGTIDMTIEFNAKADLAQKPYVLDVKMKYEDSENNPFESTGSVSIPVKQLSKFDISSIDMMPASISVGNESNMMFSIYNTGKTKLYNVKVTSKADSITGGDAFVGNLESGATGNVDVMLTGAAPTMDEGDITITVAYEDETGKVFTQDFTTNLFVSEVVDEMMDPNMDGGMIEGMEGMEEQQPGFPVWLIIVIVVLVAAVVATVIIVLKKKKKKKETDFLIEDLEDDED